MLHVEGQRNAKTLYVWDGSDARPFPYTSVAAQLNALDIKVVPWICVAAVTDPPTAAFWMSGLCILWRAARKVN